MKNSLERINQINDLISKKKSGPRSKDADIITDELLKDGLLKARADDGELQPLSNKKDRDILQNSQCNTFDNDILTD